MANQARFGLKVRGKKENVEEFVEILKGNRKQHFCCTSVIDVKEMEFNSIINEYTQSIEGYCDYSIAYGLNRGHDLFKICPSITSLEIESSSLHLDIEVYAEEPGMGFEEHFYVSNGEVLIDRIEEVSEYFWDKEEYPTLEEFNTKYGTSFIENEFNVEGYARMGGFPNWNFNI